MRTSDTAAGSVPALQSDCPLLHAYAALLALVAHIGVLTWTLASGFSEFREQHLVALGRLAESNATTDRPVQAGANNMDVYR